MRLLIYGINYAPEPTGIGPNTAEFAEFLQARGHSVEVITTFAWYPFWRWQDGHGPMRLVEMINGVKVDRLRAVLLKTPGVLRRLILDASFTVVVALATVRASRPDCVIIVSPPIQVAFPAAIAARLWNVPLILWIKDLATEAAQDTGMLGSKTLLRFGRFLERTAARLARRVVVIDPQFADNLKRTGVCADATTIPNWIDVDAISPRPAKPEMRRRLGAAAGDFLVLHTGNMGRKQDLMTLIEAAGLLQDRHIRVALIGDGPDRALLERAVLDRAVMNLCILPLQPADEYADVLAAADALIISQRDSVRDSVAPYKLINYLAAGRPVIGAVHEGSIAARLLCEARCARLVPPGDPVTLARELEYLSSRSKRYLSQLGQAGRRYCERHWRKETVLARWENFIVETSREDAPGPVPSY